MSKKTAYAFIAIAFAIGYVFADMGKSYVIGQEKGAKVEARGPKWAYGLVLRVRKSDQAEFEKTTPKIGVEVFTDENNGNTIYITETGGIAVVKK